MRYACPTGRNINNYPFSVLRSPFSVLRSPLTVTQSRNPNATAFYLVTDVNTNEDGR